MNCLSKAPRTLSFKPFSSVTYSWGSYSTRSVLMMMSSELSFELKLALDSDTSIDFLRPLILDSHTCFLAS